MEQLKKELIAKYIVPLFGAVDALNLQITEQLCGISKLRNAGKYEQLEAPGSFEEARVFFSIESMVHSYFYCPHKLVRKGTRIWKKLSFILFTSCLLEKEERSDYIQMLEPGKVLFFSYQDLLTLMDAFPSISSYFGHVFNSNESYYHHRNILLNKPPLQRVREFESENTLFTKVASKEIKALHVGLTRQGYNLQLRKLRKK